MASLVDGTTVVVGAGVFGVSTAYHLSLAQGHGDIIIVDQHEYPTPDAHTANAPLGASHDVNKIIRADYSSIFHMQLALEAIDKWRSWDLISPFYHKSGWILLAEKNAPSVHQIRENFRHCIGRDEMSEISVEEIQNGWSGSFRRVDTTCFDQAFWNPLSAWADADKAVAAMLGEAITNGVQYRKGKMKSLLLKPDLQGVDGIALEDGTVVKADRLIMATGAWTSSLMDETENKLNLKDSMRIESQVKAAGVCNVHFILEGSEQDRCKDIPIFIHGSRGEVLPLPKSKLLKFNNSTSFTNTVKSSSGRLISKPPERSQTSVPEELKRETLRVTEGIMPQVLSKQKAKVAFFRCCWDSITPQQHQLITRHPSQHLSNLFLAIGGSFHSWKFLPTIGKYVANVVHGESNGQERDKIWAWKTCGWDSLQSGGAHEQLVPKREFDSFLND